MKSIPTTSPNPQTTNPPTPPPKAYKTAADDVRYSVDFDDGDKISAMPSPLVRAMAPTKKDSFLLKVGDQAVCCPKQSVRTKK